MNSTALFGDKYKYTMAQAWYKEGKENETVTYNYFTRDVQNRNYFLVAGLDILLQKISAFRFTDKQIDYLQKRGYNENFLNYLKTFQFSGDIFAMPEGTIAFPNEPVLRVMGSRIEVSIIETIIENTLNCHTMQASKAARIVYAAQGKGCVDFSPRRDHEHDAALAAARSSYIAGFLGTSLEEAGELYGIPTFGTMGHEWIASFPTEKDACLAYARHWPDDSVFLIDTYDTVQGAKIAAEVGKIMEQQGHRLKGVRLDSGDLLGLSKKVREILDRVGLSYVKILASNDLNESKIDALLAAGACIDLFGVGTEMGVSKDAPALPGVYKLVDDEILGPRTKLSNDATKAVLPGKQQVYRFVTPDGFFSKDVIALGDEFIGGGMPLLTKVMNKGRISHAPSLAEIRETAHSSLAFLPGQCHAIDKTVVYHVERSLGLMSLFTSLKNQYLEERV